MSTDRLHTPTQPEPPGSTTPARAPGALAWLGRRWPTLLALVCSALTFSGTDSDESVYGLSEALLILPLLYLVTAAVARRGLTWLFFLACIGLLVALRNQDRVEPSVALLAVALGAVVWGTAHGRQRQGLFLVQVAGMVAFGAVAVGGTAIDADLGRYLVAAGWFAHGLWDFAHLRADVVVTRSFAEWCCVVDVLIAAQLVLVPLV
jgi:hypothetical protein